MLKYWLQRLKAYSNQIELSLNLSCDFGLRIEDKLPDNNLPPDRNPRNNDHRTLPNPNAGNIISGGFLLVVIVRRGRGLFGHLGRLYHGVRYVTLR